MGRRAKPWYWAERKGWYSKINGKRVRLGDTKKEATDRLKDLRQKPERKLTRYSLALLLDEFIDWAKKERKPTTADWYEIRIQDFLNHVGNIDVAELESDHIDDWLDTKNAPNYKKGCYTAVNRALNWAVKKKKIVENPIATMDTPYTTNSQQLVTDDEYAIICKKCSDQQFRDLVDFSWETGARPQETVRAEARHLDKQYCRLVIPQPEAKGKKRVRIVYMTDKAMEIIQRLCEKHSTGPLFRNARGDQWHRNNVSCRFERMRKNVGRKVRLYDFRHAFSTRMLKAGIDPLTVAIMLGHADPATLTRVYQHLSFSPEYFLSQLRGVSNASDAA